MASGNDFVERAFPNLVTDLVDLVGPRVAIGLFDSSRGNRRRDDADRPFETAPERVEGVDERVDLRSFIVAYRKRQAAAATWSARSKKSPMTWVLGGSVVATPKPEQAALWGGSQRMLTSRGNARRSASGAATG